MSVALNKAYYLAKVSTSKALRCTVQAALYYPAVAPASKLFKGFKSSCTSSKEVQIHLKILLKTRLYGNGYTVGHKVIIGFLLLKKWFRLMKYRKASSLDASNERIAHATHSSTALWCFFV